MAGYNKIDVEVRALTNQFRAEMKAVDGMLKQMRRDYVADNRATKGYATRAESIAKSYASLSTQYSLQAEKVSSLARARKEMYENGLQETAMFKTLTSDLVKTNTEFELLSKRMYGATLAYNQYFNSFSAFGRGLDNIGDKFKTMSEASGLVARSLMPLSVGLGVIGKKSFDAFKEYESALVGVQKTNNELVGPELDKFKAQIDEISSIKPLPVKELLNVAELGGQLNVSKEYLAEFSTVINELGITTDLNIENAALKLAQFANVMDMGQDKWRNLGNVITELGNNTATTEETIIDFSHRLVGAGAVIGMTEADILGLSAAMGAAGLRVEAGGTNLSKTLLEIEFAVQGAGTQITEYKNKVASMGYTLDDIATATNNGGEAAEQLAASFGMSVGELAAFNEVAQNGIGDLEIYASAAGMTAEAFKELWEKNPADAFQAMVEGLAGMEAKGESVVTYLEMMGIKSERQRDVMLKLVRNAGDLKRIMGMANDEWRDGNALMEEASMFYDSTEGKMQSIRNELEKTTRELGEQLAPLILDLARDLVGVVKGFTELDEAQQKNIVKAGIMLGLAGPISGAISSVTGLLGSSFKLAGRLIGEKGLGGVVGKAMTASEAIGKVGAVGKSENGLGGVLTGTKLIQRELAKVGPAAAAETGIGGVATEATTAKGAVALLGGELALIATGIAAIGGAIYGIYKQKKFLKDWISDAQMIADDVIVANDGSYKSLDKTNADAALSRSGYRPSNADEEIVRFSEQTKELMIAAQERQAMINAVYEESLKEQIPITQENLEMVSQLYHEQDMALIQQRADRKSEEIDMLRDLTHMSNLEELETFERLKQSIIEEDERTAERQAEIHRRKQEILEELDGATLEQRAALIQELMQLDAEWREMEISAIAQTEEEKNVLMGRSAEFRLNQNKETLDGLLEQAYEYKDGVVAAAQEEFDQVSAFLGGKLANGEITRQEYDNLIQSAIKKKDETIKAAEEELNGVTEIIESTLPGWEVSWDETSGKIKITSKETGESMQLDAEAWAKAIESSAKSTNESANLTNQALDSIKTGLGTTKQSVIDLNNQPLHNKTATYTVYQRMVKDGNFNSQVGYGGKNGYSSYMAGISYVPYNDLVARLHEGERVLTKKENEYYNQASVENMVELMKKVESKVLTQSPAKETTQSTEVNLEVHLNDVVIKDDRSPRELAIQIGEELKKEVQYG